LLRNGLLIKVQHAGSMMALCRRYLTVLLLLLLSSTLLLQLCPLWLPLVCPLW
jgi:hypothetical protein